MVSAKQWQNRGMPLARPVIVPVKTGQLHASPAIRALVQAVRAEADVYLFLSGGASKIAPAAQAFLLELTDALAMLVDRGLRIAVGDGGTKAAMMEAAGIARARARVPFPLVGVAPAAEISTEDTPGKTPIDPNHSYVVAVDNPLWVEARSRDGWTPAQGLWGCEIEAMTDLFDQLSRGRPAVAVVANGGDVTLREVRMHLEAGRHTILIEGSGRAADALVSLLRGTRPDDDEMQTLRRTAESLALLARPQLYTVFAAADGASALADVVARYWTPHA